MRLLPLLVLGKSLLLVGCSGTEDVPRGPCDELLSCAAAAAPEQLNEHLGNYGDNGSCWKALERAQCEKSCAALIAQIASSRPGFSECGGPHFPADADASPADASDGGTDLVAPACGPLNCAGCCSGDVCRLGNANDACGLSGVACAVCESGKRCNAVGQCEPDPNQMLQLTVLSARINNRTPAGAPWDSPFGDPDPYVTLNGSSTSVQDNTLYPVWRAGFPFTRKALMTEGVSISVFDEDVTFDDKIAGPRTLKVTEADLALGQIDWHSWDSVNTITFLIAPR